MGDHLEPEEKRDRFLAKNSTKVVRMKDELASMLVIVSNLRSGLEHEMADGMGYKLLDANPKVLTKIKELAATLNSLTDAKVRIDKAEKQMATEMTPEEERDAVATYVKSLEDSVRREFIMNLVRYHNSTARGGTEIKER